MHCEALYRRYEKRNYRRGLNNAKITYPRTGQGRYLQKKNVQEELHEIVWEGVEILEQEKRFWLGS